MLAHRSSGAELYPAVRDNVSPIEKIEHSTLLVGFTIHNRRVDDQLLPQHTARSLLRRLRSSCEAPRSHAPPRPTCTFWCAVEVCQRAQARSARQARVFVCSRTISTHRRAKRPHLDSSRRDSIELYHFSRLRSENKPPCEARASSSDMRASHTGVSAPCAADLWPSPGP